MSIHNTDIWKLFRNEFADGDNVIVVHEDTKLYWGKLKATENCCQVAGREMLWSEIVFIAHDGFPCRTLKTGLTDEQLDEIENTDAVILMRKLLTKKPEEKVITKTIIRDSFPTSPRYRSLGYGCPYEVQDVEMQIINPLNNMSRGFEETLVCKAKDGAVGMLWELDDEIIDFYP